MRKPPEQDESHLMPAGEGDDDAFYLSLGRFIEAFADAELELYRVLVKYAGVTDGVARAIFSGTRASLMIDFLRAIYDNGGIPTDRWNDLDHAMTQMANINTARNLVIHYISGSYAYPQNDPQTRMVTDINRVLPANLHEIALQPR